ncbi:MAG: rhodanese-like domain-containing protein [Fluviicola sp.]
MKTIVFFFLLSITLLACNGKSTNGKTIVVDVRQELIWKQGHGKGINIPLPELEKHQAELLKYDTVIFVCETGASAVQATAYMNAQKGHETVFRNGISWTRYN